jgi:hypothetical protein
MKLFSQEGLTVIGLRCITPGVESWVFKQCRDKEKKVRSWFPSLSGNIIWTRSGR